MKIMRLIFLLSSVSMNATMHNALTFLRARYAWPTEKPTVPRVWQNMFANDKQMMYLVTPKNKLIVELGSWLGSSTRFLLDKAPNAVVIAIDHWQGSEEQQMGSEYKSHLKHLYETFLVNFWDDQRRLIPMKTTTTQGLEELFALGLKPDLIYVDASHDYVSVTQDLEKVYELFKDATIIGDDWAWNWPDSWGKKPDGGHYANFPVRRAVIDFAHRHNLGIRASGTFWMLVGNN